MLCSRFVLWVSLLSVLSLAGLSHARIINIPDDEETIQAGIDQAEDGDTVLVQPGRYIENINFEGKVITVASLILMTGDEAYIDSTVIDGDENGTVVTFANEEEEDTILSGFTVRNGAAVRGAGIVCMTGTSPILDHLIVRDNSGNSCVGIWCTGSSPIIRFVVVSYNSGVNASGIAIGENASPLIENTTVCFNTNEEDDGVLHINDSHPVISNSIFWGNEPYNISFYWGDCSVTLSYTDLEGGRDGIGGRVEGEINWGEGNIDEDPLFADPDNGNFHLTENSPCIDTGDPDSPEDPDGTRADMGAFYFHQEEDHVLNVPEEYETIQAAIDAAEDEDTVLVADGTYTGEGNRNISFLGKAIRIMSENGPEDCIIDCERQGRGFIFNRGEDFNSVLSGFTILRGRTDGNEGGGGIFIEDRHHPQIFNCVFDSCESETGGGGITVGNEEENDEIVTYISDCIFRNCRAVQRSAIWIYAERVIVQNCLFENNIGTGENSHGGACGNNHSAPAGEWRNCVFMGNISNGWGGALEVSHNYSAYNCVFSDNHATRGGGAVEAQNPVGHLVNCTLFNNTTDRNDQVPQNDWHLTVSNCIIWGNPASDQITGSHFTVSFTDAQDGWEGEGNIDADPLFVDPDDGDFHLTADSPCIDAGNPESPLDPDSTRADMGAYYYHHEVGITPDLILHPSAFILYPAYPNPFNSTATIRYELPSPSHVALSVYDLVGRLLETLIDERVDAGRYAESWYAGALPSGLYFVRFEAGDRAQMQKVVLIR